MDKKVKHGRTIAMHWTDKRIEGVVCCVQRSRTFCGHSLDFPPHSHPPSPLGLFLCKHGALVNQSWPHLERFCILSEQFAAHHTLFAALYSIKVYSSSTCICQWGLSLCASTSERPHCAVAAAASLSCCSRISNSCGASAMLCRLLTAQQHICTKSLSW